MFLAGVWVRNFEAAYMYTKIDQRSNHMVDNHSQKFFTVEERSYQWGKKED